MKNFLWASLAVFVTTGTILSAEAQVGKRYPSEKQVIFDETTKLPITVLTSPELSDKALYQTDPMWTSDGQYILFRSSSRGAGNRQELYFIHEPSGEIIQATEGQNVTGYYLAHHSNTLFLTRKVDSLVTMSRIDLNTLFADSKAGRMKKNKAYEQKIANFPPQLGVAGGFAVDFNDEVAYITVTRDSTAGIYSMSLADGSVQKLVDAGFRIGHIQTSNFATGEVLFCHETGGDAKQRMWFLDASTKTMRPLYEETPLDWVTHETFCTKDWVYFCILGWQERLRKQANGIMRVNVRTGDCEQLGQVEMEKDRQACEGNLIGRGFWHCNASSDGKWAAGDTFGGNIWLINLKTSEKHLLVTDTKMKPDHAHPKFSPDGTRILFQSGRLNQAKKLQLMIVDIPKEFRY
ncbi:MAG: PD40 domain-containing protein [Bacteroidaceae bacterium]|nr:PD40 domain-containing protein [Bacteroidaceae bacterium]